MEAVSIQLKNPECEEIQPGWIKRFLHAWVYVYVVSKQLAWIASSIPTNYQAASAAIAAVHLDS